MKGCFNPFLVRASVYWKLIQIKKGTIALLFQSLLSQGISLLFSRLLENRPKAKTCRFQSLLSQGISLLL